MPNEPAELVLTIDESSYFGGKLLSVGGGASLVDFFFNFMARGCDLIVNVSGSFYFLAFERGAMKDELNR